MTQRRPYLIPDIEHRPPEPRMKIYHQLSDYGTRHTFGVVRGPFRNAVRLTARASRWASIPRYKPRLSLKRRRAAIQALKRWAVGTRKTRDRLSIIRRRRT